MSDDRGVLAEQDGRMMKVKQTISRGFRSDAGAEDFWIVRTLLTTARKQGWNLLQAPIQDPVAPMAELRLARYLGYLGSYDFPT